MSIDTMDPGSSEPIFPPDDAGSEPTDANPVPLSPTQPQRRTSDGSADNPEPALPFIPIIGGSSSGSGTGTAGAGSVLPFASPDDDRQRTDPATRDD